MNGAFQLGWSPNIASADREIGVLFKTFGGDHVPEQIDYFFSLQGYFHLAGGIV